MSLFRVATLLVMCGIALSAVGKSGTPQNSATKEAAQKIWGEGSVNRLGDGSPTFRSFEILVSFAAALPTIL